MGEKIVVGPINKGLRTDRTAFVIDNDSFPSLINAYQWRGRVKRKRGTALLGRLQRLLGTTNGFGNLTVTISPNPISSGLITVTIGSDVFVDPGGASPVTLLTNSSGTAVLDRTTGVLTITGSQPTTNVFYNPTLPVMGLEDLVIPTLQYPGTLGFDTTYSYNISPSSPYNIWDVSFYKNPPSSGGYTAKSTWTPTSWNGQNYQQFWTVNYQGALWATNGVDVPFTGNSIGMQFAPANTISFVAINPTAIEVTITNCPLVIGDFVFFNEWTNKDGTQANDLNFQSGFVVNCVPNTPAPAIKTMTISLPNANLAIAIRDPGIIQYLTNRSDTTKDCLRWYDGDPTNGTQIPSSSLGWVNFCPPLSQLNYSVAGLKQAQYYLVGAKIIFPYKDRLLFFGPVVQTSTGSPIYLQDTIIYSQNGTPYYTCSFSGSFFNPTTPPGFVPILCPSNQTATPSAYWEDQTGFGGFITAGIDQPINTVSPNEDALIVGFSTLQTRLLYTGNDIVPFSFYTINFELGSGSTFSIVNLDQGVLTRGNRGFIIASQTGAKRFDLDILDQVFEISLTSNGAERVTAVRDFINEWIYFTYAAEGVSYVFPSQTLQYNYRDDSWGVFNESYTTYGTFRPSSGLTWNTLPANLTWESWNSPWTYGSSNLLQPVVIGGNAQGFVIFRASDESGTSEATSLTIQNISSSTITSPNHCLNQNDYIMISGVLGTIGSSVNGKIFSVATVVDANNFTINPSIGSGTYQGGGLITRMYVPFIQTKQFPTSWGISRKTRIGPQQYLLTTTPNAQIQLLIFLSQDSETPYNDPDFVSNDSLVYSTALYTCPESTNLGLTSANINLQMIADSQTGASTQQQIWHRMNTSLIGDTVQIGFTLSDIQMRKLDDNGNPVSQFAEIELHGIILDVSPSQILA